MYNILVSSLFSTPLPHEDPEYTTYKYTFWGLRSLVAMSQSYRQTKYTL